ncbi:MAG: amidohydrolase [Actinobacteria bacterium]|nr:amidohydrolase [Actinomycetota bacterium]
MTEVLLFTGNLWCPTEGEVDALLVRDGRIVATGAEARRRAGGIPQLREHEITDGWLIPAFGDGHAHPMFGGLEAEGPQVRRQGSVEEIAAEVARWADEHPDAPWILGASYDSSLVPEGLFDARWLDAAVPDRPVALRAWDYHTMWVNTRALELAGITAETPDPPLGEIPHRPDGSVLGTLREWGAVDLVTAVAEPWPLETRIRSLERAAHSYAALGVTWVQDAWVEPDTVEVYLAAAQQDRLPIRFNLALYADPRHWPDQLDGFLDAQRRVQELGHPHLTANTVKFFADGVVENATGALLEHYCGCPGERGMLVWEPELLAKAVTDVDAAGFQPHIHTIGDRAVRVALDALEAAERANGPRDRRAVLAHVQLIDETDRDRFAALGAIANAEPLWSQLDALMNVLTVPRLGQERADTQYPWASLSARGIPMSFGSDWPVSSADPLQGMAVACSRQTDEREPGGGWTPHERLPMDQAFRCYTAGTAYQAFRDAGRLTPGADADFAVLSADPRSLDNPRDLDTIHVRETWVGGSPVATTSHPHP